MLLGAGPLVIAFLRGLDGRPQYEFYPLLLAASVWLAWDRWRESVPHRRCGRWTVAGPFLLLGLALLAAGAGLYVRWLAWPAVLLIGLGVVWRLGGASLARTFAPCFILLLTVLPPPAHYDQLLLTRLQHFAVLGSARLLDLLNVPNLVSGTTLEIANHRLLVEQACSGINSVVSIAAFTLLYAFLQRRPVVRIAALLCSGVAFVLFVNLIRIVLGAILLSRWEVNLLEPSVHAAVSFVMFAIGLGLTLSADQLYEQIGSAVVAFRQNRAAALRGRDQARATIRTAATASTLGPPADVKNRRNEANLTLATSPMAAASQWQNKANAAGPSLPAGVTITTHPPRKLHPATTSTTGAASSNRQNKPISSADTRFDPAAEMENRQNEAVPAAATAAAGAALVSNRQYEAASGPPRSHPWLWLAFALISLAIGGWTFVRVRDCWPPSRLPGDTLFLPPDQVGPWRLIDGGGTNSQRIESVARYQHRWIYRAGNTQAEVSFCYPFNALYHDAAECYLYTGWQVAERTFSHDDAGVLNTVALIKPGQARGSLVFGAFDEAGRPDLPPPRDGSGGWLATRLMFSREAALHRPSCEVQVLQLSGNRLDESEQTRLQQLFRAVRDELKHQTLARVSP